MAPKKKARRKGKAPAKSKQLATKSWVDRKIKLASETKYYESYGQTASPSWAPTATDLTALITQGTEHNERVGTEIEIQEIFLRGRADLADTTNAVRIMFVQWHGDTAVSAMTSTNVLATPSASVLVPYSMYRWYDRIEFTVLHDRVYHLEAGAESVKMISARVFGSKCRKVRYNPGPATTTGFNQIYMIMCSDSSAVTHPSVDYDLRIKYKDV